jgi:hypothetical protein
LNLPNIYTGFFHRIDFSPTWGYDDTRNSE